jgi:pyruvate/2-oxoglutarate dehydrogenase complex dihydrolipoamide dehydrogenase (E3) component
VALAEDVLQNRTRLGSKIVVIGGGMVGCETAEWIAQDGKQVMVVEQLAEVAGDLEARTRNRIGDCVQPRKAIEAVHEGFLLGSEI